MEKDIEGAKKNLEEARVGVAKLKKELSKLNEQVATSEVRFFSFSTFLVMKLTRRYRQHTLKLRGSSRKSVRR
jgi:hypothetical protein